LYQTPEPVSPAVYLVQVLSHSYSAGVATGSSLLVPQALVNVLPKLRPMTGNGIIKFLLVVSIASSVAGASILPNL